MTPGSRAVAASFTPMPSGRTPGPFTAAAATGRAPPRNGRPATASAAAAHGRHIDASELRQLLRLVGQPDTSQRIRQAGLVRLARVTMAPEMDEAWAPLAGEAVTSVLSAAQLGAADAADTAGTTAAAALATARRLVRFRSSGLREADAGPALLQGLLRLAAAAVRRRELVHNVVRTAEEACGCLAPDDALTCCMTVLDASLDAALGRNAAGSGWEAPDQGAILTVCAALKVASFLVPKLSHETVAHQLGGGDAATTLLGTVARCMSATEREVRKNATVFLSAVFARIGEAGFAESVDPALSRPQRSLVRIFHQKQASKR